MAKTRVTKPIPQTPSSIQAAALPLKVTKGNPLLNARELDIMLNSDSADVELAWYYYARIPELRYIARYISNALSQARLFIGEVGTDPTAPVKVKDSHPAAELMANFAGGINGQSEILDRLGMHLTLPGDSVLAGPDGFTHVDDPRYDQWRVYSINEMVSRNGVIFAKTIEGREEKLPDGVMPIRVWRPHPKYHWMADSPTRSSFTVLREINLLDQHVHASAVSRLAGAGLLVLPDEITFPADEVETDGEEIDPFIRMLTEVMSIAIRNRESPAAMVPIMLRGSAEAIGAIKHLSFSTPFDEKVPELRQVALRRLALGMDILPEILLGFADSNSWSAWQSDESSLRLHIVPLLQLICGALTTGWLKPLLERMPLRPGLAKNIDNLVVWYDISGLRVKPDVVGEVENMYAAYQVSSKYYRHVGGISESEKPTKEELQTQILLSLLKEPSMAPYAINALTQLGVVDLPEAADPTREILKTTVPENDVSMDGIREDQAPIGPGLPGQRSADRQVTPIKPSVTTDPNHNTTGAP